MSQFIKVDLVGVVGVGKSCLLIQFVAQRFVEDYDPTLEDSYRKHVTVDGEDCTLDLFDSSALEDFSLVRSSYMRPRDGFLCAYSVTDQASFTEVRKLYDHILRVCDTDYVPFVLVGNKCDLEQSREVSKEKGEQLARELKCKFLETSAKTQHNVAESFNELVREVKAWRKKNNTTTHKKEGGKGFRCLIL